jgi:hypothetical protein
VRYLSATSRPSCVKIWIQSARTMSDDFVDNRVVLRALPAQWWSWWRVLQPSERGDSLSRIEQHMDWKQLNVAGINGILSIVVVLYWWGCKVCHHEDRIKEWLKAVDEATWTFGQMMTDPVSAPDKPIEDAGSTKRK